MQTHDLWKCQPEAEKLILEIVQQAKNANADILKLENDLLEKTSTRLFDWIDYVEAIGSHLENLQRQITISEAYTMEEFGKTDTSASGSH
jgi:hypothetical protein